MENNRRLPTGLVCTKKEFEKFADGKLLLDTHTFKLISVGTVHKIGYDPERYLTFRQWQDPKRRYYVKNYTAPNGKEIVSIMCCI